MKKHRLLAVFGAIALLSLPVAAQASDTPPCEKTVDTPCTLDTSTVQALAPAAPQSAAAPPVQWERYHSIWEGVDAAAIADIQRRLEVAPVPSARALTPAELQYHRETVEHEERVWQSQGPAVAGALKSAQDRIESAPRPYDGAENSRHAHQ